MVPSGCDDVWRARADGRWDSAGWGFSPLLANIYLHAFDVQVRRRDLGVLVRYADGFVIMCRAPGQVRAAVDGEDRVGGRGSQPDSAWLGDYFRTGSAAEKFTQIDRYVVWRLERLLIAERGRDLHAGVAGRWTEDWFNQRGLYRLRGTVRYPKAA